MTKYREIIRLKSLNFSERNIALSRSVSRNTVSKICKKGDEFNLVWPLDESMTDAALEKLLFPRDKSATDKRMPDYAYIRKELLRNGVSKKLLWSKYCEDCRMAGEEPFMYSQFCYYIQKDEEKHRATMHINRKPGEQVEVDWAGDPAHIHMYEFFGGVAKILVPDNCTTAVNHQRSDWYTPALNVTYHEMAEHYGTAIIPARVRKLKDKPNAEGSVGNISTWITAALRNEQFFSLAELNAAIRVKLDRINNNLFQKKEGSRRGLFLGGELSLLTTGIYYFPVSAQ